MDVALFVTCLTDTFYPRVGTAVVRVLRHFGCRVHFPTGQTCCGQPAYNSGFHAEAAALLRRMTAVFAGYEHVVTPSASCATMVKRHGPALLADDPAAHAAALDLAARTQEFTRFLRDVLHVNIAAHLRLREPATYHYPCHARAEYEAADLRGWLAAAGPPAEPAHPDLCCGFGGLFAVDLPEVSTAMLGDKLDSLRAAGASLIISNEAACTLQLEGGAHRRGLPLRFQHIAEVLAESLGLLPPDGGADA